MAAKKSLKKTTTKTTSAKKTKQIKPAKKAANENTKRVAIAQSVKTEMPMTPASSLWTRIKSAKLVIIILAIALVLYLFKGLFIAAIVNGQPISRLAIIQQLEKQQGKNALNNMIVSTLIMQEAQKRHITVSDADVTADVKKVQDNVKKQGQDLNQLLAAQGMTMQDYEDQIRLQKLVEKMVSSNVSVTDKEVADYINQNKDNLPQNEDEAKLKADVKSQLEQQKLQQAEQSFVQSLQAKAQIKYFVNY